MITLLVVVALCVWQWFFYKLVSESTQETEVALNDLSSRLDFVEQLSTPATPGEQPKGLDQPGN